MNEVKFCNKLYPSCSVITAKDNGFSLVELSIVLVIIGLLTGGILSGQSLIRAAELRTVSTEYAQFKTATMTFRDKYLALPGDMKNATKFWGAANAVPATCITTAGTGTQTCDGGGDGKLVATGVASTYQEVMTFWQHLTNAGLLTGQYSGRSGAGGGLDSTPGVNVPASKLSNAGWFVYNDAGNTTDLFPVAASRHNFRLGGTVASTTPGAKLVTPEEMWGIDTKIDDGKPGMGSVTSYLSTFASVPDCSTTAVAGTAEYEVSIASKECLLYMDAGF